MQETITNTYQKNQESTFTNEGFIKNSYLKYVLDSDINSVTEITDSKKDSSTHFSKDTLFIENNSTKKDLFKLPRKTEMFITKNKVHFNKIQKWVGYIIDIENEIITAKLNDLNNPTTDEIAEFDISDVPEEDKELVSKGAGFYWSVGYVNDNGQVKKDSFIRFQRIKPWDEDELNQIADNANLLKSSLDNWD